MEQQFGVANRLLLECNADDIEGGGIVVCDGAEESSPELFSFGGSPKMSLIWNELDRCFILSSSLWRNKKKWFVIPMIGRNNKIIVCENVVLLITSFNRSSKFLIH